MFGRKKTINKTKGKTTMKIARKEEGYNVCPRCGKAPYEMMGDYETYHVGCSYCGIKNGVTSFLEFPLDDEVRSATQKEWNEQCLKAHYTEEVLDELNIDVGTFVMVSKSNSAIKYIVPSIRRVVDVLKESSDMLEVYVRVDDTLLHLEYADLLDFALNAD